MSDLKQAWDAAKAERLSVFSYRTHVNPTTRSFLGNSWDEGAVTVDGFDPATDYLGNTISWYECRPLDRNLDDELVRIWWEGE